MRAHRSDYRSALSDQAHFTIRYYRIMNLDRFIEFNCTENDRNPIVNGRLTIAPP